MYGRVCMYFIIIIMYIYTYVHTYTLLLLLCINTLCAPQGGAKRKKEKPYDSPCAPNPLPVLLILWNTFFNYVLVKNYGANSKECTNHHSHCLEKIDRGPPASARTTTTSPTTTTRDRHSPLVTARMPARHCITNPHTKHPPRTHHALCKPTPCGHSSFRSRQSFLALPTHHRGPMWSLQLPQPSEFHCITRSSLHYQPTHQTSPPHAPRPL